MTGFIARKCSGGAQGSVVGGDEDYRGALKASALFWHAQRSGALTDTLISWRDDSGLADVPVGGFYQGSSAPPALVQEACSKPSEVATRSSTVAQVHFVPASKLLVPGVVSMQVSMHESELCCNPFPRMLKSIRATTHGHASWLRSALRHCARGAAHAEQRHDLYGRSL